MVFELPGNLPHKTTKKLRSVLAFGTERREDRAGTTRRQACFVQVPRGMRSGREGGKGKEKVLNRRRLRATKPRQTCKRKVRHEFICVSLGE